MITAYERGDVAKAAAINAELGPLIRTLFIATNPVMVKTACNLLGLKVGSVRLPLVEATDKEKAQMEEVLQSLGLL
jgi:4-hydroxy-tetrahydrodipicolinate synthase